MEDNCTREFSPGQIDKMLRDVKRYKPTLMENIYSKWMVNKYADCIHNGVGKSINLLSASPLTNITHKVELQ